VEVESALARLRREEKISAREHQEGIDRCAAILEGCVVIKDVAAVKTRASRVLRLHPLKASDALQLAAALVSCLDMPEGHRFVTLDKKLKAATEKEGFAVATA
jgi:predicted nucleic acid-binding protein